MSWTPTFIIDFKELFSALEKHTALTPFELWEECRVFFGHEHDVLAFTPLVVLRGVPYAVFEGEFTSQSNNIKTFLDANHVYYAVAE